ncbi:MAG: hypothetical protein NVSMB53_16900 [Gemmatimonadaceae bacterium]
MNTYYKKRIDLILASLVLSCVFVMARAFAQPIPAQQPAPSSVFQPVPELPYKVVPNFFHAAAGMGLGEASGVALNSKGHIFVFQRVKPMLAEFDERGNYLRTIGEGLFDHPHGLRIDSQDNIWTTDDGNHLVLKLSPHGQVLLVLGRKDSGAEANWLFNKPADVAFAKNGDIYVADGYGNSRIVKFDRDGNFIKTWGKFGSAPGEFDLPHSVVVDRQDRVYVGDRENKRIQIFDSNGKFLKQWMGIGYPYGLFITPDQHIWMADGGFDRIIELDQNGKILGALGEPGHAPGQFAWAHFLALGPDRKMYVADVLNWRFQVFAPVRSSGKLATYIPSLRMFWDLTPSNGWASRQASPKSPTPSQADFDEVWAREEEYWRYVKAGDVANYLTLWNDNFRGWPCSTEHTSTKATIGDWVRRIRDDKIRFSYALVREGATSTGGAVIVYYGTPLIYEYSDGRIEGAGKTRRFTHTWMKTNGAWQIVGGMCGADPTSS